MKRTDIDEKILKIILNTNPWSMKELCGFSPISEPTLSGWKNGRHIPNALSLNYFLTALNQHLPEDYKDKLCNKIIKEYKIQEDDNAFDELKKEAEKDFIDFCEKAVTKELLVSSFPRKSERNRFLKKVIQYKFNQWFDTEKYIVYETYEIENMVVFYFFIDGRKSKIPPVIFSYSEDNGRSVETKADFKKIYKKCNGLYLLHIAVVFDEVNDDGYKKGLKNDNYLYLKAIYDEDFHMNKILNSYLYSDGSLPLIKEQEINMQAEIIFRKFIECSYLIYKEILCCQNKEVFFEGDFFENSLGIGNHPFSVRRTILFEKKLIELELKKMQRRKGEIELLIDMNCSGGLYGLRLHRYARQVLCVDSSKRVLDELKSIVCKYNEKNEENKIVNVDTELYREDTCEILCNRDLRKKADCIIVGLGAVSFIKSPDSFLRKLEIWLKKDGIVFLSSYNYDALNLKLKRFENLDYEYDFILKRFIYSHYKYNIHLPVRMYTIKEFKNLVQKYFHLSSEKVWSYPTFSSFLLSDKHNDRNNAINEIDNVCANYNQTCLAYGNYNMLIANQYQNQYSLDIYEKTKKHMADLNLKYKLIRHYPVISYRELLNELKKNNIVIVNNFIKTIMIKDFSDKNQIKYYMVLLLSGSRFKWNLLKHFYEVNSYKYRKTKIKFCTENDLRQMGYSVGGICPFSYLLLKKNYQIKLLYEYSLTQTFSDVQYTYSGRNDMICEIRAENMKKFLEKSNACSCRME